MGVTQSSTRPGLAAVNVSSGISSRSLSGSVQPSMSTSAEAANADRWAMPSGVRQSSSTLFLPVLL